MENKDTIRGGELAKMRGQTPDALRGMISLGNVPWVNEDLPGGKQRRYGAVQLVSIVMMDQFRDQGLSISEAAMAALHGSENVMSLLVAYRDEKTLPDEYVLHVFRVLENPYGGTLEDRETAAGELEQFAGLLKERATGADLLKSEADVASGYIWVRNGPAVNIVRVQSAFTHAQRLAREHGYVIDGLGIVPLKRKGGTD
jgi:hypothetical protein